MEIYLLQDNAQIGPYTEEQVRGWVASGAFPLTMPAWREGLAEWSTISDLLGIVPPEAQPSPDVIASSPPTSAQVDTGIERVVTPYLMPGEVILDGIEQSKIAAKTVLPDCVILTDKRLVILRRGVFGAKVNAANWHEIADTELDEGMLSASLTFTFGGKQQKVEHLPKAQARQVFSKAQSLEKTQVYVR